jgi:hypothetical protein
MALGWYTVCYYIAVKYVQQVFLHVLYVELYL